MAFFSKTGQTTWASPDYIPLRIPRTGLKVLDLFTHTNQDFDYLGRIDDIFESADVFPDDKLVSRGERVANLENTGEQTTKVSLAVKVFDLVLSQFNRQLSVSGTHDKESRFDYRYRQVTLDRVSVPKLDAWIREAEFNSRSMMVSQLAVNEHVYIAVGAQYARQLDLTLKGARDSKLEIRESMPEADLKLGRVVSSGLKVDYKSKEPLCIAMRLSQLHCNAHGFWISGAPAGRKRQKIRDTLEYETYSDDSINISGC